MNIAAQYAKALFTIEKPSMPALRGVLQRRGHTKLMPRIFAEYQKLLLQKERRDKAQEITPERERTRILLQLYKKLTA